MNLLLTRLMRFLISFFFVALASNLVFAGKNKKEFWELNYTDGEEKTEKVNPHFTSGDGFFEGINLDNLMLVRERGPITIFADTASLTAFQEIMKQIRRYIRGIALNNNPFSALLHRSTDDGASLEDGVRFSSNVRSQPLIFAINEPIRLSLGDQKETVFESGEVILSVYSVISPDKGEHTIKIFVANKTGGYLMCVDLISNEISYIDFKKRQKDDEGNSYSVVGIRNPKFSGQHDKPDDGAAGASSSLAVHFLNSQNRSSEVTIFGNTPKITPISLALALEGLAPKYKPYEQAKFPLTVE